MCVVVYYCSDIKICGEGGGAGGRAADQRGAGAAAAARHLGLQDAELVQRFSEIRQRADIKICSNRLEPVEGLPISACGNLAYEQP